MPEPDSFERHAVVLKDRMIRTVEKFGTDHDLEGDCDSYYRQYAYEGEEVIREILMFHFGVFPEDLVEAPCPS